MQALAIISRNDVVRGGGYGIEFDAPVDSSLVAISANRRIRGGGDNAIGFREDVTGSGILIGGPLAALGNQEIFSEGSAIRFEGAIAEGTQVQIANNARIDGTDSDSDGIQFSGEIRDQGTSIQIADNPNVAGGSRGVAFEETIDSASIEIQRNTITADSIDAILFNNDVINGSVLIGGGVADGNQLIGADEGIDFERIDGGTFEVLNNQIEAGRRGIEFENDILADARVTIGQNQIEAGQVGIFQDSDSEILDSAIVEFLDNEIEVLAADGFGYQLKNFGSSNPILIQGGMVSGGGTGVEVSQVAGSGLVGSLIIDGLLVRDPSSVGIRIANTNAADRLEVALTNGVTIQGGASPNDVGLIFDGLGLSLTGNTLADTRFEGQNGNFIELKNGALFEPGRPTLIDGTGVFWDGLDPTTRDGYLAVINRIVDFLDDPTLGLIFPGAPEIGPSATYDRFTRYEDFFRTVGSLLGPNRGVARFRAGTVDVAESLEEQASPE